MMTLDKSRCSECGVFGCVSWSATEGGRCLAHSSYIGPRADAAKHEGNRRAAGKYAAQLANGEWPSETVRGWMADFVRRHG